MELYELFLNAQKLVLKYMQKDTDGIFSQFRRKLEAPPWIITVAITINDVVVSMACRASETVFLIASANDIAPLRPEIGTPKVNKFIDLLEIFFVSYLQRKAYVGSSTKSLVF